MSTVNEELWRLRRSAAVQQALRDEAAPAEAALPAGRDSDLVLDEAKAEALDQLIAVLAATGIVRSPDGRIAWATHSESA